MLSRSSDLPDNLPADPLSEVLQDLRLSGVSYGRCAVTRPWGISFPAEGPARFHFVAAGECFLNAPALGWIPMHAGDVVLVPQGTGHALADRARARTKPLDEFPLEEIGDRTYRLTAGGGGAQALLFCCSVYFEEPSIHPLLELMPPVLMVREAAREDPILPALLDIMAAEVVAQRVGAATVLTRLADVAITHIVRAWVEGQSKDSSGWLGAIRDPKIGKALAAIHRTPGNRWTVAALAAVAGVSRSMFVERFTAAVGLPPSQYLARWRMRLASLWLRGDRLTVAEAARRLGYESEASFSRAFKRLVGVPPSTLRRSQGLIAPGSPPAIAQAPAG